jgi:hypothetical protein
LTKIPKCAYNVSTKYISILEVRMTARGHPKSYHAAGYAGNVNTKIADTIATGTATA